MTERNFSKAGSVAGLRTCEVPDLFPLEKKAVSMFVRSAGGTSGWRPRFFQTFFSRGNKSGTSQFLSPATDPAFEKFLSVILAQCVSFVEQL